MRWTDLWGKTRPRTWTWSWSRESRPKKCDVHEVPELRRELNPRPAVWTVMCRSSCRQSCSVRPASGGGGQPRPELKLQSHYLGSAGQLLLLFYIKWMPMCSLIWELTNFKWNEKLKPQKKSFFSLIRVLIQNLKTLGYWKSAIHPWFLLTPFSQKEIAKYINRKVFSDDEK